MFNRSHQNGIYAIGSRPLGNSCALLFLRATPGSESAEVGSALLQIWDMLQNLSNGIVSDLNVSSKHRYPENLTALIAYGNEIFELKGAKKTRPIELGSPRLFYKPDPTGGGNIMEGSSIHYADDVRENHALSDHILLQYISDSEFGTKRAVIETWKALRLYCKNTKKEPLKISKFYTGFRFPDQRGWLGFHDGVSNIITKERKYAIDIDRTRVKPDDKWTENGTYLAFLRIVIDFEAWQDLNLSDQERLVGRHKLTGCPLIGIDKNGSLVKDPRCPVRGTTEVIEEGNEFFREHPAYGKQVNLSQGVSDAELQKSHIARVRKLEHLPPWQESRIYRQGFSFLESSDSYPGFMAGLNFISYQNSIDKFRKIVASWMGKAGFGGDQEKPIGRMDSFLSVRAAGVFFVPSLDDRLAFPGADIVLESPAKIKYSRRVDKY